MPTNSNLIQLRNRSRIHPVDSRSQQAPVNVNFLSAFILGSSYTVSSLFVGNNVPLQTENEYKDRVFNFTVILGLLGVYSACLTYKLNDFINTNYQQNTGSFSPYRALGAIAKTSVSMFLLGNALTLLNEDGNDTKKNNAFAILVLGGIVYSFIPNECTLLKPIELLENENKERLLNA